MTGLPEPRTAPGSCHMCSMWTGEGLIVAEIDSNSGAGATIVRCPACCANPRPPEYVRQWLD